MYIDGRRAHGLGEELERRHEELVADDREAHEHVDDAEEVPRARRASEARATNKGSSEGIQPCLTT